MQDNYIITVLPGQASLDLHQLQQPPISLDNWGGDSDTRFLTLWSYGCFTNSTVIELLSSYLFPSTP